MIPSQMYADLCPEIKENLNLSRLSYLEELRRVAPEASRVASKRVTDTYVRHPELSLSRSILEAYTVLAMYHHTGLTGLTDSQFKDIKAILQRYGVFN